MTEIKTFTETDIEFQEIARLYNLVSHDDKDHPDDVKDDWLIRDKNIIRNRLFLNQDNSVIGYLGYGQGRDENKQNCYFNIYLDPNFNGNGYRQQLYDQMLQEVQAFRCNRLYMSIYEHENYDQSKIFLVKNGFENNFKIRESSLDLGSIVLNEYSALISKLDSNGIMFYDARDELSMQQGHYEKLEELKWVYAQDFPMPDGTTMTRFPFGQYMKYQKLFEEQHYGIEIIAVDGDQYVGSTDIHIYPKSNPHKAWTGSLGVLRKYRRWGIATALKIKAFEKLREKGVKTVRTDNEENNPMYLINVALGFTPEPYCLEYQKEI